MLKHISLFVLLSVGFILSGVGAHYAYADIYLYINDAGETCIADDLGSVPEKYRATAVNKTAREEQTQIQSLPQSQSNMAARDVLQQESMSIWKMTFTSRLIMTAVVVCIWLLALFAINKTKLFKGHEKVLPASRIALACFLLVYLVLVHGKDVVNLSTMAGNKIEAVQEKQAQRGRKAGEAIKAFNKLMDGADKPSPPPDRAEE
jgi:hypothetical protein